MKPTAERCFACGRPMREPVRVDTRDGQQPFVGRDCARRIYAAGVQGWEPAYPHGKGGPRLYPIANAQRSVR